MQLVKSTYCIYLYLQHFMMESCGVQIHVCISFILWNYKKNWNRYHMYSACHPKVFLSLERMISLALPEEPCLAFYLHSLIMAWMNNYIRFKAWNEITYPIPTFNGAAVDILGWILYFPSKIIFQMTRCNLWTSSGIGLYQGIVIHIWYIWEDNGHVFHI